MQAIILTAGKGARLSSWTANRPKGMVPLGNRPILDYLVSGAVKAGIREINMVVGYGKTSVMSYFGDGSSFGCKIRYLFQEECTGTLDAMLLGFEGIVNDFLLIPGDNYVSVESFRNIVSVNGPVLLSGKADRWSKWGEIELEKGIPKITFDNPEAYGRIHFTGILKMNRKIGEQLFEEGGRHIGDALQKLVSKVNFEVIESEYWHNIVYPWDLISGNRLALRDNLLYRHGKIEKNVVIRGEVSIGKGTVIRSGSYLSGPISIGESCDIGPNTVIDSSVSIGDNVTISSFSEISDSIIMQDCDIGSYSSLKGTVIGNSTSVGSHSIAIPISRNILYFDKTFSVSDRGAMIGDNCTIGSRAILQGGSILLSNATIGEGEFYNADFQGENI
ncbi:MAG: hypothetical protein CXT75_10265 [Methanobacteriota archaeon]|nr:MAG: hypothetical protein CXT75_10265 [Euryarchaeota archaeon]